MRLRNFLNRSSIEADRNAAIEAIVIASAYGANEQHRLQEILKISVDTYSQKRVGDRLWVVCEGKEVLNDIARTVGFADSTTMVQASFMAWEREEVRIPDELETLRKYLKGL